MRATLTVANRLTTLLATIAVSSSGLAVSANLDGETAPDFALKSLGGENLRLSEYRGEVVMLNFWATWCGACQQVMPRLEDMYATYQKAGLMMLGVNLDEDSGDAADMARSLGVSYPILWDATKDVSRLYDVKRMPVTVLIDRSGVVRHVHSGYRQGHEEAYIDEIRSLLRE